MHRRVWIVILAGPAVALAFLETLFSDLRSAFLYASLSARAEIDEIKREWRAIS